VIGKTNRRYWRHFDLLPANVQKLAREKYALWKSDPQPHCLIVLNRGARSSQDKQPRQKHMNTETTTGEYMLLFRGPQWDRGLSTDELQQVMDKMIAWFEGLNEGGKIKGAQPLGGHGRVISGTNGRLVVDGPFTETKEAVGGFKPRTRTRRSKSHARCRSCVTASALKSARSSRSVQ
jgi:hypothetical protein